MQPPRAVTEHPSKSNAIAFPAEVCQGAPLNEILHCRDINLLLAEKKGWKSAYDDLSQRLFVMPLSKTRFLTDSLTLPMFKPLDVLGNPKQLSSPGLFSKKTGS